MTEGKQVIIAMASYKAEYYTFLKEQMASGKLKSIIDRCYPLVEIAEAHRYVEAGAQKGKCRHHGGDILMKAAVYKTYGPLKF